MTFPVLSASTPSTGYNLTRSLRFRSSASAYLNRTPASSGNQQKFTWSSWVKLGALGTNIVLFSTNVAPSARFQIGTASNALSVAYNDGSSWVFDVATTAVYRDPSAWYHIVIYIDTTQATATNRAIIYVNNVSIAYTGTNCPLNQNFNVNTAVVHSIGRLGNGTSYLDGYLAEVNFVDGQALTPSSFGSTNATTGVWQPAKYTGTYGTNGFYLPFTDNSALTTASNAGLGKDFSGNANYWVTNNISITAGATYDSMTDVPTLTSATAANFCVLNPLFTSFTAISSTASGSANTITNGNLTATISGAFAAIGSIGTIGATSGKYYFEYVATAVTTSGNSIGLTRLVSDETYWYRSTGSFTGDSTSGTPATWTTGDVIGVAADLDSGTITFYKNNVSQGTSTITGSKLGSTFFPVVWYRDNTNTPSGSVNFGQRPFSYTPPSGFVALNTYNLPASTVPNGASYMAATLYTGTGASLTVANTVGSASFQPDFVWIKSRSAATDHKLTDVVRGVTKGLISNTTGAETTDTTGLTAFGSTGFTVGANTTYNNSGATYVAWQWKAGGTAVSNTNGSITSSVSANTTSGCSVVTYTGTGVAGTIGHGLGVAPSMIIVKSRSAVGAWPVYHSTLGNGSNVFLNTTAASTASATIWNATSPTSSVFSVGINTDSNTVTVTYVAYCFAAIKGFSAFGSYTGNGSTDGPFVYTGFLPRFVLVKCSSDAESWIIVDSARDPNNDGTQARLFPDTTSADSTVAVFDFLSNGFKNTRGGAATPNVSGRTYIYMAFAQNPFQNALAY